MTVAFCTNDHKDCNGALRGTTGGKYDPAYVSDYLYITTQTAGSSTGLLFTHEVDVSSAAEVWLHFDAYLPNSNNGVADGEWFRWVAPDGTLMAYGDYTNGTLVIRVYNAAGGFSNAAAFTLNVDTLDTYDFQYEDDGANCYLRMYENDTLQRTATVAASGAAKMPTAFYMGHNDMFVASNQAAYSQIIHAYDESTVGMKLEKLEGSAAGTHQDISETVGEINDGDRTTGWASAANGEKQSYTLPAYAVPGGRAIHSVNASARLRTGAAGTDPLNVRQFIRSGSTDYNAIADRTPARHQYGRVTDSWITDPDTAVTWTAAGVSAAEVGFEVKT